jgi:glycosyltransferase involved in cell wall biosynthesis
LNLLFASRLADEFSLLHFQVGSEGRNESTAARLLRFLTSPLALAATVIMRRAAIVHFNTALNVRAFWRDLTYLIAAKICGAKVLYQVHGGALPQQFCRNNRILCALLRGVLRCPDAIVVLSSAELDAYRRFVPGQQVLLLPNAIDYAPYTKYSREPRDPTVPLRLLYIGRLAREKGLHEVLWGLKCARKQGVKVQFVIAGSGPEEECLKRLAGELGLTNDVSFVGPVFGQDKVNLFDTVDVFVLASYAEGLPYALLESMAAGVPVIVTRVGAIPDVVADCIHGLFVPPRDPAAISHAVATLASNRQLLARMSAACRKRVADRYPIDRLAKKFGGLYAELCDGNA